MNYLLSVCLMVCLAVATNASAQNESYKDLMVRMQKATNTTPLKNTKPKFIKIATEAIGKKHTEMNETQKGALASELVEKYMQDRAFEDITEFMLPYFEKHISLEEMKAQVEIVESERYQNMTKRMALIMRNTTMNFTTGLKDIMEGKTPETITAMACTESYLKAFKDCYKKSGGDIIIGQLTASISNLMKQAKNTEENSAIFSEAMNYLNNNFETIMLNIFIESGFTENDLNYVVETSTLTDKVMIAMQEMLGNINNIKIFNEKVTTGFSTWLESQEY